MNKKIKELALQAGGSHYPDVGGKTLEKFAELIVRECIHVALRDALPTWDNAASEANAQCVKIAADLKEHFGVEE